MSAPPDTCVNACWREFRVTVTRWHFIWHIGCDGLPVSTGIPVISRISLCPGGTTINGVPWFLLCQHQFHIYCPVQSPVIIPVLHQCAVELIKTSVVFSARSVLGVLPLSCQLNVVKHASEDCPSQAEPGFPHHLFTPNTVEPFVSTRVRFVRAQTKRWCRQCGRNKSRSFVLWLWVKEGVNNTGDRFITGTLHWLFTVDINKRDWRRTQTEHSI